MLSKDEDALICDMAEYYHIYRMRELPVKTLAVLAFGLPPESRIKMALADMDVPPKMLMLALIADKLSTLVWLNSADGQKGRNRPASIVESITSARAKKQSEIRIYRSGEAWEAARKRLLGG